MIWKRRPELDHCDEAALTSLLDTYTADSLDTNEMLRASAHLDHCQACQAKLTQLSATSEWWVDAGRWLEPEVGGANAASFLTDADCGRGSGENADQPSVSDDEAYQALALSQLREIGLLTPPHDDRIPESLGKIDRYHVTQMIGMGGTGIVLRAVDGDLNRVVAIKVLSPELAISGAARKRFAREGQACAAVAHEHVVAIHQVEALGKVPYLVMQYIDGLSLQEYVTESGPLSATETLRLTAQIASALDAAHAQGLVHRDVKPANILIDKSGGRIWITDFGLARAVDDASLTRTGFIAGTPHYMSPEQARGETISGNSDLFSLGSVVYFMLTGRPPFRAERTLAILNRICTQPHRPVREVISEVPESLESLVDRLLAKRPPDRFASALELRDACLQLLSERRAPTAIKRPAAKAATESKRTNASRATWLGVAAIAIAGCSWLVLVSLPSYWSEGTDQSTRTVSVKSSGAEIYGSEFTGGFSDSEPPVHGSGVTSPFATPPAPVQLDYPAQLPTSRPADRQLPPASLVQQLPNVRPALATSLPDYSLPAANTPPHQSPAATQQAFGDSPSEISRWESSLDALAQGILQLGAAQQQPLASGGLSGDPNDTSMRRLQTLESMLEFQSPPTVRY